MVRLFLNYLTIVLNRFYSYMILDKQETYELTLIPTERCNLNCAYCMVDKSKGKNMSYEIAKREIDKMMAVSIYFKEYIVSFMGGEPFLAFDLIKQIVEYVKTEYWERNVYFKIVTNGTLVNDEIKKWISDNIIRLHVTLSLDGKRNTHNKNRCNSFDCIDIPFFASLPSPTVNMVISPTGLNDIANNIIYIESKGFYVKAYLEEGISWRYEHLPFLAHQLSVLIEYYLKNTDQKITSILHNSLHFLTWENKPIGCGTHKYSYHISADGARYDCHRCMPFEQHPNMPIDEVYINDLSKVGVLNEACRNCFISYMCNICPASNAVRLGKRELSEIYCLQHKLLYKAQANMVIRMLLENPNHYYFKHLPARLLEQTIEAAKIILKTIDTSKPF